MGDRTKKKKMDNLLTLHEGKGGQLTNSQANIFPRSRSSTCPPLHPPPRTYFQGVVKFRPCLQMAMLCTMKLDKDIPHHTDLGLRVIKRWCYTIACFLVFSGPGCIFACAAEKLAPLFWFVWTLSCCSSLLFSTFPPCKTPSKNPSYNLLEGSLEKPF